jgi:hypothetical protein
MLLLSISNGRQDTQHVRLACDTQHKWLSICDTQDNIVLLLCWVSLWWMSHLFIVMLNVVMPSVVAPFKRTIDDLNFIFSTFLLSGWRFLALVWKLFDWQWFSLGHGPLNIRHALNFFSPKLFLFHVLSTLCLSVYLSLIPPPPPLSLVLSLFHSGFVFAWFCLSVLAYNCVWLSLRLSVFT